ncbi:MAG: bacterial transcriptional activator domain-containing protein [Tepidisphaeraceae bacterium]
MSFNRSKPLSRAKQSHFCAGKYAEAIKLCQAAVDTDDRSELWWTTKLKSEIAIGRYADALKTYEAGVERLPASLQLYWLGRQVLH